MNSIHHFSDDYNKGIYRLPNGKLKYIEAYASSSIIYSQHVYVGKKCTEAEFQKMPDGSLRNKWG